MDVREDDQMDCKYCSKQIQFHFHEACNNRLRAEEACFSCDFWLARLREYQEGITFVADGKAYTPAVKYIRTDKPARWRGFGGVHWMVKHNGEEYITNDLWGRGVVPEHFREWMPDNAELEATR